MNCYWDDALKSAVERLSKKIRDNETDLGEAYREAALSTSGLPVYCDLGGCLVLTASGGIVLYEWDEVKVSTVLEESWRTVALVAASEKYAELRSLRPATPADAVICDACGGSGKALGGMAGCGRCYGTGWLTPRVDP